MPTEQEEEYFARQEAARLRKLEAERQARLKDDEKEQLRALHYMHCPKCGSKLQEMELGGVKIDKCFSCEGLWLDKGELETMQKQGSGFLGKLIGTFRV